jgi:predicted RNA-binding protein with PUA-like domain
MARNTMRLMKTGDRFFFYHSNTGLAVVGIGEISGDIMPDPSTDDPRWECVTVRALCDMPVPVSLKTIKANPRLAEMSLVTSFRLSVQPVTAPEWKEVCRMGGLDPKTLKPV